MAQDKTARNTVPTSTTRSGGATATTLRPMGAKAPQAAAGKTVKIPCEQIAQRAHDIWVKSGCKHGQDEQNWFEAERQLKAEASK
jgi:hypothetical protein